MSTVHCWRQSGNIIFRFMPLREMHITARAGEGEDSMRIFVRLSSLILLMRCLCGRIVLNWFDQDAFKEEFCSIKDTLGSLLDNPLAGAPTHAFCEKMEPGMLRRRCNAALFARYGV